MASVWKWLYVISACNNVNGDLYEKNNYKTNCNYSRLEFTRIANNYFYARGQNSFLYIGEKNMRVLFSENYSTDFKSQRYEKKKFLMQKSSFRKGRSSRYPLVVKEDNWVKSKRWRKRRRVKRNGDRKNKIKSRWVCLRKAVKVIGGFEPIDAEDVYKKI